MESTLQIMPVQRTSRNFGEYAEEAVIIEAVSYTHLDVYKRQM